MKELKCPKCGNVFKVDEADYAFIVSQVRNAEFDREVERRLDELSSRHKVEQELAAQQAEQGFKSELGKKDKLLSDKDAEIMRLKSERDAEIARLRGEKDSEIARLKSQLEGVEAKRDADISLAIAEKDKTIAQLNSTIEQGDSRMRLALMEERDKMKQSIEAKNAEIARLKADAELEKAKAQVHEAELMKQHESEMRAKQELVDYYKDMKTRLSTKMVGETLEIHCSTQFNQMLRPVMPNAYFEKDNDASDGTKGDFIFRDTEDGIEYISIMFEMKNEMDTTPTKHKNEDFFKKLDEDRKKKNCEFAVLVSLLEPDSELYNGGIVDVSYRYDKMYVIRPQFFLPIITLLVQTSKKSLEYKKQLIQAQSREVDVTNFENKLMDFKAKFGRHYELASHKFKSAIDNIDATIKKLQKVREDLVSSENNLRLANQDADDLTIRKLTYKNPTMKRKFDEARDGVKP